MKVLQTLKVKSIQSMVGLLVLILGHLSLPASVGGQSVVFEQGLIYRSVDNVELKLDVARPDNAQGPFPALMYLCGNGWGYVPYDRTQYSYVVRKAAEKGYVAVTVDYRSALKRYKGGGGYIFPAQVHDVKCAVRWLRANAAKYGIDSERIGVVGWSSGGNLALMLGLTKPTDGLEGDCEDMAYSSSVQAIVNIAGPTELSIAYDDSENPDDISTYLGNTPQSAPEQYRKASPLTYVSRDAPPILTIQGDQDTSVKPKQSYLLDARIREVGGSHILVTKEGYGHMNFWNEDCIWDFLDKNLRRSR